VLRNTKCLYSKDFPSAVLPMGLTGRGRGLGLVKFGTLWKMGKGRWVAIGFPWVGGGGAAPPSHSQHLPELSTPI
jgi:hypothetical protein